MWRAKFYYFLVLKLLIMIMSLVRHKTNPAPVINIRIVSCFKRLAPNHAENPIVPSESLKRAITFPFLILSFFIISVEKFDVATKSIPINVIIFIQVSIYVERKCRAGRLDFVEYMVRDVGVEPTTYWV